MKQNKNISNNTKINLNDLEPVNINNPQNNEILKYNGSYWENDIISSSTSNLNDLTDVTISSPTNNQIFLYNGSNWVNDTLPTFESGTYTPSTFDRINCNTSAQLSHYVRINNNVIVYYFIAVNPSAVDWSFKINLPISRSINGNFSTGYEAYGPCTLMNSNGGVSLGVITNSSVSGTQRLIIGPNANYTASAIYYIIGTFMYEI